MTEDNLAAEPVPTEVGSEAGEFRLWMASEAMRQAEIRLASQAASLSSLEARATAVLSWSATTAAAAGVAATRAGLLTVAAIAGLFLAAAALCCLMALWPSRWHPAGFGGSAIESWKCDCELEVVERVVVAYETGIGRNSDRLRRSGHFLRVGWCLLVMAPIASLAWAFLNGR